MNDFNFYNPTKVIFGKDKESEIAKELNNFNIQKVMLLYGGGSIKKSGLFDRVFSLLNEANIEVIEFGGVKSNPTLSHTKEGIKIAKGNQVDAILAVGGGSVMDEAKAIAVGVKSEIDVWDYFLAKAQIKDALPVFTIVTLSATASEMNGNSVITNEELKQKYSITSPYTYPKVSIINPELTTSVPLDYTAYSSVDAIAHVIEAYFTGESSTIQDGLVEAIIKSVIISTDKIMVNPKDYDARAEFSWSATLALNGLTTAGVKNFGFPNHMIEHSLSAIYDIAHGAGLSIVIPAWMKWYLNQNEEKFKRFAIEVFNLAEARDGIEALESWFKKIGAPTKLSDVNIPKEDIDLIAKNATELANIWGLSEYNENKIKEILTLAI